MRPASRAAGEAIGVSTRRAHAERATAIVLTLTIAIPIVVAIVRMVFGPRYFPTIDWAVTELRVRDVLHEFVTVGPYSRYGWNHPGPLLFYLLAIPYWLSGHSSISMHVTAAGLNLVCVIASCALAWRRLRLVGVIAVAVPLALLVHALGPNQIRDPWNPYLPMLALFLFVLLMWSVAVGDVWLAVPAAIVGSFIVQSHVGFVGVVGAVSVGALFLLVRRRVGSAGRAPLRGVVVVTALMLGACWFPVAYGTAVQRDGNLHHVFDFLTTGRPTAGWSKALQVMGLQWGPRPEWIFGSRGTSPLGVAHLESFWWLAIGLLAAAVGLAIAIRRRDRTVIALGILLVLAVAATTFSAAEIFGPIFPYLVRWTWITGAFLGVVTLLGVLSIAPARAQRVVAVVAVIGLTAIGVLSTVAAVDAGVPYGDRQAGERSLSRQVIAALPPGHGPVLIDTSGALFAIPGLTLQIERHGIPVMISPEQLVVYGPRRLPQPRHFRAVLAVAEGADAQVPPVGGRRIAWFHERNAAGRTTERVAVYLVHPRCAAHVDHRASDRGADEGPICAFVR